MASREICVEMQKPHFTNFWRTKSQDLLEEILFFLDLFDLNSLLSTNSELNMVVSGYLGSLRTASITAVAGRNYGILLSIAPKLVNTQELRIYHSGDIGYQTFPQAYSGRVEDIFFSLKMKQWFCVLESLRTIRVFVKGYLEWRSLIPTAVAYAMTCSTIFGFVKKAVCPEDILQFTLRKNSLLRNANALLLV